MPWVCTQEVKDKAFPTGLRQPEPSEEGRGTERPKYPNLVDSSTTLGAITTVQG